MKLFYTTIIAFLIIASVSNAQWLKQQPGTNQYLTTVSAVDSLYAWTASAFDATMLRTTNGGQDWIKSTMDSLPIPDSTLVNVDVFGWHDIWFLNRDTGIALLRVGTPGGYTNGVIVRSTDGGQHWSISDMRSIEAGPGELNRIFFLNRDTGWVVGYPINVFGKGLTNNVLSTIDGGTTWSLLRNPLDSNFSNCSDLYAVHFATQKIGWVGGGWWNGSGALYKTTDGGLNYTEQTLPSGVKQQGAVQSIFAINENIVFINQDMAENDTGTNYGRVSKTTNGGTTWTPVLYGIDQCFKRGLEFVNDSVGWTVSSSFNFLTSSSSIYKTTDQGATWILQDSIPDVASYLDLDMVSDNIGWAVGINFQANPSSVIKRTINGGGVKKPSSWVNDGQSHMNNSISIYPQPLEWRGKIDISVSRDQLVKLEMFDVLGEKVITVFDGNLSQGSYSFPLDVGKILSGVYVFRLMANGTMETKVVNVTR